MYSLRSLALSLVGLALSASLVQAQDLSRYREFQLGMTVAAVTEQARLVPAAVRLVHERPQVIQELDWLPQQQRRAGAAESEAVRRVRFRFCDGFLYRITVESDRNRIEGLTAEDFVQAISASYGLPILSSSPIGGALPRGGEGLGLASDRTVAAQWEDLRYLGHARPDPLPVRVRASARGPRAGSAGARGDPRVHAARPAGSAAAGDHAPAGTGGTGPREVEEGPRRQQAALPLQIDGRTRPTGLAAGEVVEASPL